MKIAALIARNLLGLMFVVFGLNGFLHFIPQPPPPAGLASQFLGALGASHYMVPVFALQLVGGALLLANRFVPLALVLLGPVIANILLFHVLMARPDRHPEWSHWRCGAWFFTACAMLLRACLR
jgi:uncharacterized membrane protein YphA (DoxX/SURF4 family)